MNIRKMHRNKPHVSSSPSDYVELYMNSNLAGKGVSLKDSMSLLAAIKYPTLGKMRKMTRAEIRQL